MRRFLLLAFTLLLLPALPAAPASAAKPRKASTIKLVSPMRVQVGKTLTIRGTGFSSSRRRNTVIFRAPSKRTAFAKPRRASRRKLVVGVPGSVERLLRNRDGKGVGSPTRFTLRVVVARRYGKPSSRRNSPVIISARRSGQPASCGKGSDFDDDLLSNAEEARIKTDPCDADSDGDRVEDGFEQTSARDLNQRALPYPGKRPFANALDPADAGHDYDGDGLASLEEFQAWAHAPFPGADFGGHRLPFNYSDGDQTTGDVGLSDDARDADGDGLRNIDEIRLLMFQGHYPAGEECGYEYRPVLPRAFLQVDYLEWDSDGDGVWDGNDDQDNDGVSNVEEVAPPYNYPPHPLFDACGEVTPLPMDAGATGRRHPYNPCLPYRSEFCRRYEPRG